MTLKKCAGRDSCTRRDFIGKAATAVSASLFSTTFPATVSAAPQDDAQTRLAFTAEGKQYRFDTDALRGTLRSQGRSLGLTPVVDSASGATITRGTGLFSHYRILDAEHRYGHAAWDWASESRLLDGGSVEVVWSADNEHPFDMRAVYRWATPNTLDVTTSVVARKDMRRFEVFLASYFGGFPASFVYVKGGARTGGKPVFHEAKKSDAVWQMFPRDEQAVKKIGDGRWKRPPHPVGWRIMPQLAAPLAMRRDARTGLTGLVMAPAEDCFAVATPYGEEGHRSLYLSLLGRDLKAGERAIARSRLVIGRKISDEQAAALYAAYVKEMAGPKSRLRKRVSTGRNHES